MNQTGSLLTVALLSFLAVEVRAGGHAAALPAPHQANSRWNAGAAFSSFTGKLSRAAEKAKPHLQKAGRVGANLGRAVGTYSLAKLGDALDGLESASGRAKAYGQEKLDAHKALRGPMKSHMALLTDMAHLPSPTQAGAEIGALQAELNRHNGQLPQSALAKWSKQLSTARESLSVMATRAAKEGRQLTEIGQIFMKLRSLSTAQSMLAPSTARHAAARPAGRSSTEAQRFSIRPTRAERKAYASLTARLARTGMVQEVTEAIDIMDRAGIKLHKGNGLKALANRVAQANTAAVQIAQRQEALLKTLQAKNLGTRTGRWGARLALGAAERQLRKVANEHQASGVLLGHHFNGASRRKRRQAQNEYPLVIQSYDQLVRQIHSTRAAIKNYKNHPELAQPARSASQELVPAGMAPAF